MADLNDPYNVALHQDSGPDLSNPVDAAGANMGPLAWLGQAIGLSPSAAGTKVQLGQLHGPDAAAYTNTAAPGALSGMQAIGGGSQDYSMDYSSAQPGQNAQNDAMGLAGGLARGVGPSMSRSNMNLGLSQGMNNLASLSAGAQGGAQGGLGARNLLNAAAGMQGQAAGQGALAGAQEQIGNIQNYGALGSAARAQGLTQAGLSATNAHQNTAQQMSGLNSAMAIGQTQTQNAQGLDAARTDYGNARAGLIGNYSGGLAQTAGQVLHGGANVASSASRALPSFGGGSSSPGVSQGFMTPGEGHFDEGAQ